MRRKRLLEVSKWQSVKAVKIGRDSLYCGSVTQIVSNKGFVIVNSHE